MQLSDNEKRDIIKYLEADKLLPDKYRFLLFADKQEVELVWNGKTSEVTNVVLPFQVIEQVDEPRSEKEAKLQQSLFDIDTRGRQLKGWTNKLIWGDNKLILSSLKNGPLRQEIQEQGGIKLIYIDPPFDVGADFSMNIEVGEEEFTKKPGVLEELAYRDTWGKGADSFIVMIYERLSLMHDLLASDGSILVHCDWRVSPYIRLVLDEIFGKDNHRNDIVWHHDFGGRPKNFYPRKYDTIYWYSKSKENWTFNYDKLPLLEYRGQMHSKEKEGKTITDVWDIAYENKMSHDNTGYPTQKPKELLKRFLEVNSNEGDLIADFFAGSGTTLIVAENGLVLTSVSLQFTLPVSA